MITKPPKIPPKSGVYFFKNQKKVLYIGKANNLSKRIASYFNRPQTTKNRLMLQSAVKVSWKTTESEFSALILEAKLIKKYQPKYNLQLKDDKRYPSIAISVKEKFPRVYFTREPDETKKNPDILYFDPFPSAQAVKSVLSTLRQIIPYRTCHQLPKKTCLYHHLHLCPGVCVSPQRQYRHEINKIIKILNGQADRVLKSLTQAMKQAANQQQFEKAAKIKNQIQNLQMLVSNSTPTLLNNLLSFNRVEGYDIANLQGQEATGSMVVFRQGQPDKNDYRHFKIKTIFQPDDPRMIAEILKRRLAHREWPYPDLILIDGGKTQVSAAEKILKEQKQLIPVIGLIKNVEKIIFHQNGWQGISLPQNSPHLNLLQRLRDEAHRFSQRYHHHLRLKKIFLTILLTLSFIFPTITRAENEFITKQEVTYDFADNGRATIQEKISLENLTSSTYASRYNLTVNSLNVQNFKAWDNLGPLNFKSSQFGQSTEIELIFNQKVAGLGETLTFFFEYQTSEVAKLNGKVWEITTPKIENFAKFADFQLTLKIPQVFGQSAYFSPRPENITAQEKSVYTFTKKTLSNGVVTAVFGEYQVFNFDFSHRLANPDRASQEVTVALIPDTAYQRVFYSKIDPEPVDIKLDTDGNWLASFLLKPKSEISVQISGSAQVFLSPQYQEKLSDEQKKSLLSPQKYWPTQDEKFKTLSQNLKSPQDVYDWLVGSLDYDYERVKAGAERLDPLIALENKKGLCLEFTDIFVTLCRAIGIPSRAVNGYAYSESSESKKLSPEMNILHSWPEYYDQQKQTWIPVDPTWGKTTQGVDYFHKLDLNHLTFVIHGQDSLLPVAVGSGEFGQSSNQLRIAFGQTLPEKKAELKINFILPTRVISGVGSSGQIEVVNLGNQALYQQTLYLETLSQEALLSPSQFTIPFLPPFSKQRFLLRIRQPNPFSSKPIPIRANINQFTAEIEISSFSLVSPAILVPLILIFVLISFKFIKNLKPKLTSVKINHKTK